MRIYHIATAEDWARARRSGSYTTSTRGRALAEEGFLHASRREQVAGVFAEFYADASEPLVLLGIDTDRLDVPWREDPVGAETFPHIYGPLDPRAVVTVEPLDRRGGTRSFGSIFLEELLRRAVWGTLALLPVVAGAVLGDALAGPWVGLLGAGVGILLGGLILRWGLRRRAVAPQPGR